MEFVAHPSPNQSRKIAAVAAFALFFALVIFYSWMAEDALITFRTVDNFVHGRGLTWNPGERVQAYTHPLWLLLLAAIYFIHNSVYAAAMIPSWLCTIGFGLLLLAPSRARPLRSLTVLLLLCACTSFLQFCTSGLENPLSHFLVALFVVLAMRRETSLRNLMLVAAAILINRIDAILLVAPLAAFVAVTRAKTDRKRAALDIVIGLSPFFAWELFSLMYYGALVPNTALAKLGTGIPLAERLAAGAVYYRELYNFEPATVVALLTLIGIIAFCRTRTAYFILAGIALHLFYILWVGGDFMCGRFFSPTIAFAAAAAVYLGDEDFGNVQLSIALMVCTLSLPSLARATTTYHTMYPKIPAHGVVNERAFYPRSWLFGAKPDETDHTQAWSETGATLRARGVKLMAHLNVGYMGFAAGPDMYIVDKAALTDPFLARLPARRDQVLRVGHFFRLLPPGYFQTIETGHCEMAAKLCPLFDDVWLVTHGPLFSAARWHAIARLQFGHYKALANDPTLVAQTPVRLTAEQVQNISMQTPIEATNHGVGLFFPEPRLIKSVELTFLQGSCFNVQADQYAESVCPKDNGGEYFRFKQPVNSLTRYLIVHFDVGRAPGMLYGLTIE